MNPTWQESDRARRQRNRMILVFVAGFMIGLAIIASLVSDLVAAFLVLLVLIVGGGWFLYQAASIGDEQRKRQADNEYEREVF